jgi:hypothetical protein
MRRGKGVVGKQALLVLAEETPKIATTARHVAVVGFLV